MIKKRYLLLMAIVLLFIISAVNAEDDCNFDDNLTACEETFLNHDMIDEEVASNGDTIYFDASAKADGDGSKSNPYKDINNLNNHIASGNDLTVYFADGTYNLNSDFKTSSNVVLIGAENVTFDSVLSGKYDFEIMDGSALKLVNITFNHINILNHGTLEAYSSNFYESEAFAGYNAPLTYNMDSSYGGVIACDPIGYSVAYLYLDNCVFNSNSAYCGGAISLINSNLVCNNSQFYASKAERKGGVIYALNSNVDFINSFSYANSANYGGVIYTENSNVNLKDSKCLYSEAYSFGGIIASKYSDIDIDSSYFSIYYSMTDSAGAIYNFEGNLNINDTGFYRGSAEFGGAICNLNANLTINKSFFINNTAGLGGAVYNIYGKIDIENTMFCNSSAYSGASVYSKLSDTSYIVNNVFVNSIARTKNSCIFFDSSCKEIVQYGNHFEDVFYLCLEFSASSNNEIITLKSNVLRYVMSNDGIYNGSYGKYVSFSDSNDYYNLNIYDSSCPGNSTVFSDYNNDFTVNFNFTTISNHYMNHLFKFTVYNHNGDIVDEFRFNMENYLLSNALISYPYSFKSHMFLEYTSGRYTVEEAVVPSINSTFSDSDYIPSSYDSRDYGYVTPVKDQAEGGNCWAFAGIATLEACIKKATGITYDFSEENVKNMMSSFSTMGLDIKANNGGYDLMVMGYLTAWFGPVMEVTDRYDDSSSLSNAFIPAFHVQNICFLPQRQNGAYDYLYKKAIMDYGAVAVTFDWANEGLHSVSLVGWDDNYIGRDSLGKLTRGAWIFKNSWGSDWGDNGFGYISYSTPFESDDSWYWHAYSFIFNKNDNYEVNLHPDFSGVNGILGDSGHITCSIKFGGADYTISELSSFATYFITPTKFTVSIYDLKHDRLILTQDGYSEAGYYTIPFYKSVIMQPSDSFLFLIEFKNDDMNYLAVCNAEELTKAHFQQEGNCYLEFEGEDPVDFFELEAVPCIHLFSKVSSVYRDYKINIEVDVFDSVDVGEWITIDATLNSEWSDVMGNYDVVKMLENNLITFNINGKYYYSQIHDGKASLKIKFDTTGTHTLLVSYDGNKVSSNDVRFSFNVCGESVISATAVSKVYGGSEKSVITLKDANGNPIANAVVYYNVAGKSTKLQTDSKGQATLSLSAVPNTYTATVSFSGNENYNGASTKVSITIKKATPKITASKKTFKLKKTKSYTITLKNNKGNAIKSAKVTIKVNGKTYTAKTNSKGKATFKLNKLKKKGTFTATIKYAGSKYYNSVKKTVKITVKK